ncbi:cellulase family glycosylhydrolase [Solwaraspora sp. WMMA2065]|uniref:cellulase family glycosylhydrolase n=1 Tax=Solwaraspora sp. WMMA2065 TaxID=3015166 RepID=UPI00259AF6E8|nr:cellulase family glycosylhydrolase [Solwaraspora sp. WMMA2065]WJK35341.1 cellulase family glycosylhydrolase [Solwaraspora sp. WMMA2065]
MKTRLSVAAAALLALVTSVVVLAQPAHAAVGLHVSGGQLVEANGTPFVLRGVNHAHTWYTGQTSSFVNIKSLGANAVRVVLSNGHRWNRNDASDVANVISLCKANRLICVLEVHDTTGYGEEGAASSLASAADYWIGLASVLRGQENYVIINIGNEPFGNSGYQNWASHTTSAVQRLRAAGFEHAIMVDAPNWGQDWTFTMRDNAQSVWNADPARNLIFSIHMYGVFDTAAEISDYLGRFRSAGLPIAVGEFGHDHSDGNPDEDSILSYTRQHGIGWLGWSWSGNSGGVEYLDMVNNFNVNSLTPWGQRLFNGTNGIRETAREATVYSGGTPPPTTAPPTTAPPTTAPPTTPPPAGACTATYAVIGQWQGGFQGEVRVTAGGSALTGWRVSWTFASGQSVNQAWNATVTSTGASVSATNVSYNGNLGAGQSTTFGFIGSWTGSNPVPTLSCAAR